MIFSHLPNTPGGGLLTVWEHLYNDDQGNGQYVDVCTDGSYNVWCAHTSSGYRRYTINPATGEPTYQGLVQDPDRWALSIDYDPSSGLVFGGVSPAGVGGGGINTYTIGAGASLTHQDQETQLNSCYGICFDGAGKAFANFGSSGVYSYSYTGGGTLTYLDKDDQGGNYLYGIAYDSGNSFIISGSSYAGILSTHVAGDGTLTYKDNYAHCGLNSTSYTGIQILNSKIYTSIAGCAPNGIQSLTVDGAGAFTVTENETGQGNTYEDLVYNDYFEQFIAACNQDGLRNYTVNPDGTVEYVATNAPVGAQFRRVAFDDKYIYAASITDGLHVFRLTA